MKKIINYVKRKVKSNNKFRFISTLTCTAILAFNNVIAYADGGIDTGKLESFNDLITFILSLVTKLGIGLAVWGGVEVALSLKNDSAEQKDKGFKLFLAGIALICVGASASYFTSL